MVQRQVLDRTMRECMDVRILLAQRYRRGTFRVMYHADNPKDELPKITKKKAHIIQRISINYNSSQINPKDLVNYLGDHGHGHFAVSPSRDGISDDEGYDARLVGFVYPEAKNLSKFT